MGQELLADLLSCYSEQLDYGRVEDSNNDDHKLTQEDEYFLRRLLDFRDSHTLRYANIDFLYGFEF